MALPDCGNLYDANVSELFLIYPGILILQDEVLRWYICIQSSVDVFVKCMIEVGIGLEVLNDRYILVVVVVVVIIVGFVIIRLAFIFQQIDIVILSFLP